MMYQGEEVKALYWEGLLVWERPSAPTYGPNVLAGKFADDSTESDWYFNKSSFPNDSTKVEIPVNPETKEFDYILEWSRNYQSLEPGKFSNKLQHIYHLPENFMIGTKRLRGIFDGCVRLESCDLSGLSGHSFGDIGFLFNSCENLKSVDLSVFSNSELTDVDCIFQLCEELTEVNFGVNFNVTKCTNFKVFGYNGTPSLSKVTGHIQGIGAGWTSATSLSLINSPLTNASAMVFINGLAEVSETKTLKLKQSTYDTLTQEQIATATAKGWTIAV